MTDVRPLRAGEQLGRYALIRRMAMGGMAEIWSAKSVLSEEVVALKVLLPHLVGDGEFRTMFADEVDLALRLRHENIVRVHEGRYERGYVFLVMELVDGLDLRRVLTRLARQRRWVPTPIALGIAQAMARGLVYAHLRRDQRGRPLDIVHRDISPHNVMLDVDGGVKLLDFGIARARERQARTKPGVVKGKSGYMAPEQAVGAPLDQRTDIFALGIVLWEMMAMQRLFSAENDIETMDRVIAARVPPLIRINDSVPPEAADVIHHMLARSPRDRPQSMVEVENSLTRAMVRAYPPESCEPSRRVEWLKAILEQHPKRRATAIAPAEQDQTTIDDAPTQPTLIPGRPRR